MASLTCSRTWTVPTIAAAAAAVHAAGSAKWTPSPARSAARGLQCRSGGTSRPAVYAKRRSGGELQLRAVGVGAEGRRRLQRGMILQVQAQAQAQEGADGEIRIPIQLPQEVPFLWLNPKCGDDFDAAARLAELRLDVTKFHDARTTWERLAPAIAQCFPDTDEGAVSSPLTALGYISNQLRQGFNMQPTSYVKQDNALPICGSVKARGGVYEVLKFTERVAVEAGLLGPEDCRSNLVTNPAIRQVLGEHRLAVGSTGNLGLSIGITGAAMGIKTEVHMSRDAKEWKKALLRSYGVTVVEHAGNYSEAVKAGRASAAADPRAHFVDDEQSEDLLLGYSTAAFEVVAQLDALGVQVSEERPLVVHIPCGVGGAPAGICWGLHHLLGNKVRVLLAEPTKAPCVLLGLQTGLFAGVSVEDIGLDAKTVGDGLAVARASALACEVLDPLVQGVYTVRDEDMYRGLAQLLDLEGIFVEPSCATVLMGPAALSVLANAWMEGSGPFEGKGFPGREAAEHLLQEGVHMFWMTGGGLVPEEEREAYNKVGLGMLVPNADMQALMKDMGVKAA